MKIYKIYLRTVLTESTLRKNVRRILNKINLSSQYISIQTKFMVDGNLEPTQSLGIKFYIDFNNKDDKEFYLSYLMDLYLTKYSEQYDPNKITGLNFTCLTSAKQDYTNFINRLNREKDFDKNIAQGIVSKDNLPFNTLYKSWGNVEILSKILYSITDVNFCDNISSIKVNEEGLNPIISLFYKDNVSSSPLSFTDILSNDKSTVKRTFSNNLIYFFNSLSGKPALLVDGDILPKIYQKDDKGEINLKRRLNIVHNANTYTSIQNRFEKRYPNLEYEIPKFNAITLDIETYLDTSNPYFDLQTLLCFVFSMVKYITLIGLVIFIIGLPDSFLEFRESTLLQTLQCIYNPVILLYL